MAAASYLSYLLARGCNHYLYSAPVSEVDTSPVYFVTGPATVSAPVNNSLVDDYSVDNSSVNNSSVDDSFLNDSRENAGLEKIIDSNRFMTDFFRGF